MTELQKLKEEVHSRTYNSIEIVPNLLALAERLERQRDEAVRACKLAVYEEPELPGEMPDEMWDAIKNDRDAVMHALRLAVRQTKEGIISRIDSTNHGQVEQ